MGAGADLNLVDSVVRDSRANFAGGGGIHNQGTLTLDGTTVTNNSERRREAASSTRAS